MTQAMLFQPVGAWRRVIRCDPRARYLADRHYSRQTIGAAEFMPNVRTFVLLTHDDQAVWGVVENLDPVGALRWRCSIFRNEGPQKSSALIREATRLTYEFWEREHLVLPPVPLQTECDPSKVRHKRDPGRCFRRAGWSVIGERRGLIVLQAPELTAGSLVRVQETDAPETGTMHPLRAKERS